MSKRYGEIENSQDKMINQLEKEMETLEAMRLKLDIAASDNLIDATYEAIYMAENILKIRLARAKGDIDYDYYLVHARVHGLNANNILTKIKHINSFGVVRAELDYLCQRKDETWDLYEKENEGLRKELLLKQYEGMSKNTSALNTRLNQVSEGEFIEYNCKVRATKI